MIRNHSKYAKRLDKARSRRLHPMQKAAAATSEITSGSLDWLIANAGLIPEWSSYDPLSILGRDTARLTQELNSTLR